MSTIGENIRRYRMDKGMSVEELALRSRIGTHKLEQYEANEFTPNLQVLLTISTALDCPASDLMEHSNPTGPCQLDSELQDLINAMGQKRVKLILKQTKDIPEDQFLRMMELKG